MLLRKYSVVDEEISDLTYFAGFQSVFIAWTMIVIGFFLQVFLISFAAAGGLLMLFLLFHTYLEDEAVFKLVTMLSGAVLVLESALFFGGSRVAYAMLPSMVMVISGVMILYYNDLFESRSIEFNWLYALPMLWVLTNLLGAVAKSRLIFLSTFSAALAAGYGFSKIFEGVKKVDFEEIFDVEGAVSIKYVALGLLVGSAILVNGAAGFMTASSIGGSPSQAWDNSLEYMETQTEPGSSIMSWWDYGYHFESIGRRPSIANGWNAGYYASETRAVNMPLADFFTSSNPMNRSGLENFLEKHSVDYIVLDHTMIGKYSAVSTISGQAAQLPNETKEQPTSMLQIGTSRNIQDSLSQSGNLTLLEFSGSGITVYAPVEVSNTSVEFTGAPTVQTGSGRRTKISCVMTENGTKTFDVNSGIGYCLAEDPYYSLNRGFATNLPARGILVPEGIQDSTLVQLYLEDGTGLDWAEKVPGGSNDYVKMWKVTG
jgi:hypothetical protein